MVTAASARTIPPSTLRISPPRGLITRPRTPASEISTFEPPPSTVTATRCCEAMRIAASISSLDRVSTNHCAGPPTRNVVSGASGVPS
jgi:hypothetical protein